MPIPGFSKSSYTHSILVLFYVVSFSQSSIFLPVHGSKWTNYPFRLGSRFFWKRYTFFFVRPFFTTHRKRRIDYNVHNKTFDGAHTNKAIFVYFFFTSYIFFRKYLCAPFIYKVLCLSRYALPFYVCVSHTKSHLNIDISLPLYVNVRKHLLIFVSDFNLWYIHQRSLIIFTGIDRVLNEMFRVRNFQTSIMNWRLCWKRAV